MYHFLKILYSLLKIKIGIFVSLSVCVGYIFADGTPDLKMIGVCLAAFLLSAGASGFNECQENREDSVMERTKHRPIPKGEISISRAIIISSICILLGTSILIILNFFTPLIIGLAAVTGYNLFYTPLKKKSAFIVFPGALTGIAGPVMGWSAAGMTLWDLRLAALSLFFFIWQAPHFLLMMISREGEYRKAGFPVITDVLSRNSVERIIYVWSAAMAVSAVLIPFINSSRSIFILIVVFLMGLNLLWKMKIRIYTPRTLAELNIYVLLTMILLCIDRLFL